MENPVLSQEEKTELIGEISTVIKDTYKESNTEHDAVIDEQMKVAHQEIKDIIGITDAKLNKFVSLAGLEPDSDPETWDVELKMRKTEVDAEGNIISAEVIPGQAIAESKGYDAMARKMYMPRVERKTVGSYIGFDPKDATYGGLEDVMKLNDQCIMITKALLAQSEKSDVPMHDQRFIDKIKSLNTYHVLQDEIQANSELRKAMDTATAGEGSEWVPTELSAQMIDAVRLELLIAAQFDRIPLPRASFELPVQGARPTAFLFAESIEDEPSAGATTNVDSSNKVTFAAKTFGTRILWSRDLDEDSILAVFPIIQRETVQALADGEENSIINGDTSTTHQHSDVTASSDVRKAFPGLLFHSGGSGGNAAVDISTFNLAATRSMRKGMGKYGAATSRLRYAFSISAYIQALAIDEVRTIDKYGAQATVVQGELARIDNIPILISEFVRNDLNTTGVYDGATLTDTEILLFNASSFIIGDVRGITTDSEFNINTQQNVLVNTRRMDFQQLHTPAASGEETVALGYSLTA